jgi:hypothetical protein
MVWRCCKENSDIYGHLLVFGAYFVLFLFICMFWIPFSLELPLGGLYSVLARQPHFPSYKPYDLSVSCWFLWFNI